MLNFDLLDQMPIGCCALNGKFEVICWNQVLMQWSGIASSDAVGQSIFSLQPHLDKPRFRGRLQDVYDSGAPAVLSSAFSPHFIRRSDDSSDITQHTTITQVMADDDPMVLLTINDVSEQARRMALYKEAMALARQEASQRKLREQELEVAVVKANDAVEAKSRFLAAMSHEFRTPLNGIIGMAGMLNSEEADPGLREQLGIIQSCGESLLELINDVLDFSKIEAQAMDLECRKFELRDFLDSTVAQVAQMARSKGVQIYPLMEPASPCYLLGDSNRLRQVLLNLLSNALKFTEKGYVRVVASFDGAADGRICVRVAVQDTGIGISESAQENIFQPFTQAESGTARRFGGTGLGLTISKRLCQMMDGDLHLSSVLGEGSTFTAEVLMHSATPSQVSMVRPGRVFVVDSSAEERHCVENALQCAGYEAVGFASLQELPKPVNPSECVIARVAKGESGQVFNRHLQGDARFIALVAEYGDIDESFRRLGYGTIVSPVSAQGISGLIESKANNQPSAPDERLLAGQCGDLRVLVVEDNIVNQKVIGKMLSRIGIDPVISSSGEDALEKFINDTFDIIFMDCQMPNMDGYQTTDRIRTLEREWGEERPRTPVVALTANAMEGDREKCLEAGMDDYVSKPIRLNRVIAVLNGTLSLSIPEMST